jgi:hypothetical protein
MLLQNPNIENAVESLLRLGALTIWLPRPYLHANAQSVT